MFAIDNVPTFIRKLTLKLDSSDDGTIRICELTFKLSRLTLDLARAIAKVPVANYCFWHDAPKWDINDVKFAPPEGAFVITLRAAPDLPDPSSVIPLAVVTAIRVWRPDLKKRDLALEFVTQHELQRGDARDLAEILTQWEAGATYASFAEVQLPLDLDAGGNLSPDVPAIDASPDNTTH